MVRLEDAPCAASVASRMHCLQEETFQEDCCHPTGHGRDVMAIIDNLILRLVLRQHVTTVADARRYFGANQRTLSSQCP